MGNFYEFLRKLFAKVKPTRSPTRMKDLSILKRWESLRLKAYKDGGGVWTIGWGHTRTARRGMVITNKQATELLNRDLKWVHQVLNSIIEVPLNQNQYDALGTFIYNIGATQFANSSLLRKLNNGDYASVPKELLRWVYDNGEYVQGLKNRRKATIRLYLS